jgi:hypothetical protein
MSDSKQKFFQDEKKFVVGKVYETLRVKSPPWGTYSVDLEKCDEIGTIIPNTEKFLGKYVSSLNYGYGDNGGRYDYFTNAEGKEIGHCLDYNGTTRYREVKTFMNERLPYLSLIEGIGNGVNPENKNEHINKYVFNQELTKEICSFMNPDI